MLIIFLLAPEVALANAEFICYASPNTSVVKNDEYSLKGNPYLYPENQDEIKTEYYHDLDDETRHYFESLWEKVIN